MMYTYENLEYMKDEIDVGGASTSSYIHPYAYRATRCLLAMFSLLKPQLRCKAKSLLLPS